jgi:ectoine hydroxylase-related dioxygenase (phytanoyl-CoA dioxygenase family)
MTKNPTLAARERVTPEQLHEFTSNGYLMVRQLFDEDEMELLLAIAKQDQVLANEGYERKDAAGGLSRLALRNELDDSTIYTAIVRSQRVAGTMEQLLGDEVYHYHHKMMLKEPRVGGAWEWHQDYGYWYNNGCLYPDMASCLIAVDRANRENGCLQVIRGSHNLGRLDHGKTGDQSGADLERVAAILERLPLVYCEMDPGDALFFHGNVLHRSDQNKSEYPRWSLICCYNTRHNDPYVRGGRHPSYSHLEKWPHDRVKEIGLQHLDAIRKM